MLDKILKEYRELIADCTPKEIEDFIKQKITSLLEELYMEEWEKSDTTNMRFYESGFNEAVIRINTKLNKILGKE